MRRSLVCVLTGAVLAASMIGTVCLADEAKTFTVGFDAEYPPFGYMDEDGELSLIHISEPTRPAYRSRMPSSA